MEKLIETINEIEQSYKSQKKQLQSLKIATIVSVLSGFFYAVVKITTMLRKLNYTIPKIFTIEIGVLIIILIPVILTPLYMFFSDNIQSKFNWDIKTSIFKSVLYKYNVEYMLSFKSQLTDADIKNLNLEGSLFTFAYGDDLILGYLNEDIKFRISEMHSASFTKKKFDGLIGVLIYSNTIACKNSFLKFKENNNANIKITNVYNKIYFLKGGDNKHFEFRFKGMNLNKEKLISDYLHFNELAHSMFEWRVSN